MGGMTLLRGEVVAKIFRSARHSRAESIYGGAMFSVDSESTRGLLEGVIAAFSVLGGCMAYLSGYYASQALAQGQPPEHLSQQVNEGLGLGFRFGYPLSIFTLMIMMWS
jgi:hypothetical protein